MKIKVSIDMKADTDGSGMSMMNGNTPTVHQNFVMEIPNTVFEQFYNSTKESVIFQEMDERVMSLVEWNYEVVE